MEIRKKLKLNSLILMLIIIMAAFIPIFNGKPGIEIKNGLIFNFFIFMNFCMKMKWIFTR